MIKRCEWANTSDAMTKYHDNEWGQPLYDDQKLFELLTLEIMQAGLSWSIILNKRDSLRKAFDNFELDKVKDFNDQNIKQILNDKNVIRNIAKIKATINNAKVILEIQKECGSFSNYLWKFVNNKPIVNSINDSSELPTKTQLSIDISNDMKKKGFKFTGPVTIYSFIEAMGMINDHENSCFKK